LPSAIRLDEYVVFACPGPWLGTAPTDANVTLKTMAARRLREDLPGLLIESLLAAGALTLGAELIRAECQIGGA